MRVIVTGAASGIGRCFAETLAGRGDRLGLIDVAAGPLESVRKALDAVTTVQARVADVADGRQVSQAVDELAGELGGLDWAIHCAAILGPGRFADQRPGDFERVIRVNLLGTANVARAVFPHLRVSGGALACLASTAAVHGWPRMSAYSASKFGVSGLCDALRAEFARAGVGVTAVYPLLIDTPLLAGKNQAPILARGKAIAPAAVVRKTIKALERRRARVYVPARVWVIAAAHALFPSLLDAYGRRYGLTPDD
ncbi:MAG: SDR family NAD(P)-dependent oxidoreductase [Candidatus Dadabacteria bacterium]|nr:MAG: SDR family NAD(P)-dependent oxidoreductase [Candidatus Dadabacteria bacterium]